MELGSWGAGARRGKESFVRRDLEVTRPEVGEGASAY